MGAIQRLKLCVVECQWSLGLSLPSDKRIVGTVVLSGGIGMKIDNNVHRDDVEMLVRELINVERGKKVKKIVMELKTKAEEATKPGSSSYKNMEKLITEILKVWKF